MIGSSNAVIKMGGGGTPLELSTTGIDFIDYDGTVLAHYDSVPAALPTAPTVEGLDFQEWNWTIADLQEYFTANPDGYVCVGATRAPSDGKTHIKIKLSDGRLSPKLWFASSQNKVEASGTIDWGDGIIDEWARSTLYAVAQEHTYQQAGEYEIVISVEAGEISVNSTDLLFYDTSYTSQSASYNATIKEIYFGDNFLIEGSGTNFRVLQFAQLLEKVTWTSDNLKPYYTGVDAVVPDSPQIKALVMPRGFLIRTLASSDTMCVQLSVLSLPNATTGSIWDMAFSGCYSLARINIPDGVTSIRARAFNDCYSLASVYIPNGVTSIRSSAFQDCYSLTSVNIPDGVTSIESYVFQNCYSLTSVNIPDGATIIGDYVFQNCYTLPSINLPGGVTSIGSYTFSGCYSLTSINIPDTVTSIGSYAFNNCYSLTNVNIPNGVTSVGNYTFNNCCSLASVSIPNGVATIGSRAFYNCYFLKEVHLQPTTPPTLSNANAFSNTPSDMVIYVPQGTLEAYQQATNWTTYASQMQEE